MKEYFCDLCPEYWSSSYMSYRTHIGMKHPGIMKFLKTCEKLGIPNLEETLRV